MSPAVRIGTLGFGLIAVCYGFARFAFGMFLPQIDADLGLGSALGGVISGGSFGAYCVGIVASAMLTERLGARTIAMAAAVVAAVGMAGIALAPSPLFLAAAVMVAGSSTGLASPPMAAAVASAVRSERQELTNTTINAGTSAGVALSGPVALAMVGQWRLAFAAFAAVAVVLAIAAALSLPAARGPKAPRALPAMSGQVVQLIAACLLMGAASTAIWSFGGEVVSQRLGWKSGGTATLWSAIGIGGIAGAGAGGLVRRFGLNPVHRAFLGLMAAAIFAVGSDIATPVFALIGSVVFGASYVMLTGVYLVWGVGAFSERPATGLMIGFLTLAIGQTAGAPIFGVLMAWIGTGGAIAVFAALAVLAGMFRGDTMQSPATGRNLGQPGSSSSGVPSF